MLDFSWVDVFAARPYAGNQLAVFSAPADLPEEAMRLITREMNHSETTFLQPPAVPQADGRVRIFIPTLPLAEEIPFAGHPILGTACVAAPPEGGMIQLQTGARIITVCVQPLAQDRWMARMSQPLPRVAGTIEARAELAAALGADLCPDLPVEAVDNGMQTVIIPLASLAEVQQAQPDPGRLRALLGRRGLCTLVFAPGGIDPAADVHCRVFSPYDLVVEDPATGSANGPLGEYLVRHGVVAGPVIRSEQGHSVGRPSLLQTEVERYGGRTYSVYVSGEVHLVGRGGFRVPVRESYI
ncbi:MAG TPA: PhzF family phenazine biosynthesis protein [Symbiobacteriaceae bacterium]|nr:PhzF family phenazine biosynthesis protein [Symbiobacteriaceae bacterium]